jgi:uncharacterized membrane protein
MVNMNSFLSFQVHAVNDIANHFIAIVGVLLPFLEGLVGKGWKDIFSAIMPGVSGLANVHPLLVHFPIAFLSAFFVVDVAGTLARKPQWRSVASWFLYFGTVATVFTVTAGFIAAATVPHGGNVHEIMTYHKYFGVAVLCLALVLSAWRAKSGVIVGAGANVFFLMLSALLCIFMAFGADLGGLMVYKYGVAVEAVQIPDAETHVHADGETHVHGNINVETAVDASVTTDVKTEAKTDVHVHADGHQHVHKH